MIEGDRRFEGFAPSPTPLHRLVTVSPDREAQLETDANAFSRAEPGMYFSFWDSPVVASTIIILVLFLMLTRYTSRILLSLAMIDSPPRMDGDTLATSLRAHAGLAHFVAKVDGHEKSENGAQHVGTRIESRGGYKPLTTDIRATLARLRRIGGHRSLWRGAHIRILYRGLLTLVSILFCLVLPLGISLNPIAMSMSTLGLFPGGLWHYIQFIQDLLYPPPTTTTTVAKALTLLVVHLGSAVLLAPVRATWTYAMIALPSPNDWFTRMVPWKCAKVFDVPTILVTLALEAINNAPLLVSLTLLDRSDFHTIAWLIDGEGYFRLTWAGAVLGAKISVILTLLIISPLIALPIEAILARVEISILSEDERIIVPFDRASLVHGVGPSTYSGAWTIFTRARRSLTRAEMWRVLKLWVQLTAIQMFAAVLGLLLLIAQARYFDREGIAIFVRSFIALLRLAAIHDAEQSNTEAHDIDLISVLWIGVKYGIRTTHAS